MRVTAVGVCLLVCALLCGLLTGVAGATTYYWITPAERSDGSCCSDSDCADWVPSQAGVDHWTMLDEHDGATPPPAPNFVSLDHGDVGVWYTLTLGGSLSTGSTYNMVQMGATHNYTSGGITAGRQFGASYVDWNGNWRTDVAKDFILGNTYWNLQTGPIYEFQSGSYATSPANWDLTGGNLPCPAFHIQSRRIGSVPSASSNIKCDEVWAKVWNRDASWPATAEPTTGIKYFYPSGDTACEWSRSAGAANSAAVSDHDGWTASDAYVYPPSGDWVVDTYALDTDIPDGSTAEYNRMQLVAVLSTGNQAANFRASYERHDIDMVDLDLQGVNTGASNYQVFRGPIVRVPSGWRPAGDPLTSLTIESGSPNLHLYEIYVRVWNAT